MSVCLDFFSLNAYTIGVDMCVCLLTINSFDRLCQQLVFFICQPFGQAAEPQAARCTAKVPLAINVMLGGAGTGSRNIMGKFDKKEKKKEKK